MRDSAWLFAVALLAALAAADTNFAIPTDIQNIVNDPKFMACATYFEANDGSACESASETQGCPKECASFLKGMPADCRSWLDQFIPKEAAAALNNFCGSSFEGSDDAPSLPDVPDVPDVPDQPSTDTPPQACVDYVAANTQKLQACASITNSKCPQPCADFILNLPSECTAYLIDYVEAADVLNEICGNGEPTLSPSPSPSPEESPLPSPSPLPDLSPFPYPDLTSNFTCDEGDGYTWAPLDPDAAIQWGVADWAPESGPEAAIWSNCTNLFLDAKRTPSDCCSETKADLYPWWQYEFPSSMQVKGVRVTPPSDTTLCCLDDACSLDEQEPCRYRLGPSFIFVGNSSIPDFYNTSEYKDYLKVMGGNVSLAQAAIFAQLTDDSTLCNQITDFDLLDQESGEELGAVNVGCGVGAIADSKSKEPKGQYVSILLNASSPKSLALCGIEICAKKPTPAPKKPTA